jgi:hypothetical protein
LLAAVAATLGYVSVSRTLAYPLRASDPERARALSPGDGRITALAAQTLAIADATPADRIRADRLARTALQQDPTAVSAVSTLGIDAQLRGDTAGARRLFAYAETLSRRDIATQLWAVEDAVGRGDVNGALRHYDIALRTSSTAPDLLFPVLASAIADPAIRVALTRTLAARPSWGDAFLTYVAAKGPDPRATARLLTGLRRAGLAVSDGASAEIVNLLISSNFLDDAWSYHASVHPGIDRRRSRDPRFMAEVAAPSPFDWVPLNDGGITTSIQRGDRGGIFDFAVPASVGGPLLRQVQVLPAGDYRLEGHGSGIEQPEGSAPYWVLSCGDGRELGRVVMPNSSQAGGRFAGRFVVPTGCPIQTLTLVARPSDMVSGVSGEIDQVRLFPAK